MTACKSWQFLKLRSAAIRLFPGRWSGAKRSLNLGLYLRRPNNLSERFDFRLSIATHTGGESTSTSQPLAAALYLVATPIGNLEDITLRALRVLREADIVLAEDTRHSQKLLNHYGIKTAMYSLHEHNEVARIDKVTMALMSEQGPKPQLPSSLHVVIMCASLAVFNLSKWRNIDAVHFIQDAPPGGVGDTAR